ncbi:ROK family protein [Hydrogenimonas sp. SS33]|uniref:ROK family protein n=1 Tax=Hydrogenimonas leucolamina TaxID=2954236 RepID=UPI00336C2210
MSRLAIDIGGTWLRYELVGPQEFCGKIPSRKRGLKAFIEEAMRTCPDIDTIAVSYAGQVHGGSILSAPNIEVDEPDIADWVEAAYGIPLMLENDLNCAALAESVYWESGHLVALYSGTGLGSGIIEKGEIFHGFRSLAAEVGHVPYRKAPFRCGCGKDNCLELYASGSGLQKWMRQTGCEGEPDLGAWVDYGETRNENRESGNENQQKVCHDIAIKYLEALSHAAATLVTLCNPEVLVLGGGVVAHNPWVADEVRTRMGGLALAASLEGLRIERSAIQDASLEGAKILLDRIGI